MKNTPKQHKKSSNILFLSDEHPIHVNRDLARILGLDEAIVTQQLHYWIRKNTADGVNYRDGCYWTYNSLPKWQQSNFDFWTEYKVKATFTSLVKKGVLITGNYNEEQSNRSLWYTIDYDKLDSLCNYYAANPQEWPSVENQPMTGGGENTGFDGDPPANPQEWPSVENQPMTSRKSTDVYITDKTTDETREKKALALKDKIQVDEKELIEVPINWTPEPELVKKIKTDAKIYRKLKLTDDDIYPAVPKFRGYYRRKGELVADISGAFEYWCSQLKPKQKGAVKDKPQEDQIEKRIQSMDEKGFTKQEKAVHVRMIQTIGYKQYNEYCIWNWRLTKSDANCWTFKRDVSSNIGLGAESARRYFEDALKALGIEINKVVLE